MPAARPRASFEPIPPDFDVRTFVEGAERFQYADRISYEMIASNGMEQFEKLVLLHVIIGGKPLVIDGFEEVLDPWTFTPSWLRDNHGGKVENARNLTTKENIPLTIKHYIKHMNRLTEQFFDTPERYRDKTRQRIYLKDIDCPPVWQDKLKEHIPQALFYLNESTGEPGGPGALDEPGNRRGRGIGRAGDLMSSLPPEMRAENLMCYIGHEGTYTPSHREMCASLGQNIMVNASGAISEDGKPERPGSSLWFMTETKDRHLVSEYWLSVLGHDIEVETHFAQLIAWKKAPFRTYVVEQRPGDFILIPPLAPHQVWNRGTRTMKIAWNRTTVETLALAMSEALPNSRIVCRDEQYKNKAIIYYTLLKYSNLIKSARAQVELGSERTEAIQRSVKIRQVQRDFKRLFDLYKSILLSEMFRPDSRDHPEFIAYDSNVTCAYCRCNIFNRFLTCTACKNKFSSEIDEPYDICMDCYCMGRSCACQSGYTWVEQWKWKQLVLKYEEWRAQIIDLDGQTTEKTPLPLQEERRYLGKKTLAQVCQEQLKLRPVVDINNPVPEPDSEEDEIQVDQYGMARKPPKKSKQWLSKHKSCHTCLHRHPKWKMAFCSNCDHAYCYGSLFRGHDLMPFTVMEEYNWKCPHCRRVCNTGACRRDPRQHPYEPKGTLLGHDTKKVADPRSVECLVDFSISNLNWLRDDEAAMQHRREEAERARLMDPSLDDRYVDDDHDPARDGIAYSPGNENSRYDDSNIAGDSYVAPTTAIHGGDQGDDIVSFYPDPDADGEIPRLGKHDRDNEDVEGNSQPRKKKKKTKHDSAAPLQPKSMSGKEYQKEVERKLLEDAKRDDRFILVAARMKGKSKIIKLRLSSDLLEVLQQRVALERPAPTHSRDSSVEQELTGGMRSILQSDILPTGASVDVTSQKETGPKTFRYRVADDETYSSRRRNPDNMFTSKPRKPAKNSRRYEEFTVESDEDFDNDTAEYIPGAGRQNNRASNWLARKNEGEEALPTELPPDFRDGDANPHREKNRERQRERQERRRTTAVITKSKATPSGRLPGRPRKNAGGTSNRDGVGEDEAPASSALLLAQSASLALEAQRKAGVKANAKIVANAENTRAVIAAQEAEDNLKAKMGIAEWFEDSDNQSFDGFINDLAAEDEPLVHEKHPAPLIGPPKTVNSIFSKPGMAGKKIKIVSAQSKRNGEGSSSEAIVSTTSITGTVTPGFTSVNGTPAKDTPRSFTSVNGKAINAGTPSITRGNRRVAKAINLSDDSESDSEDEIPARAPTSPKTRPSIIPTRGRGSGRGMGRGRGRGRPRKTL